MSYSIEVSDAYDFQSEAYTRLFEAASCSAFCSPLWLSNFYSYLAPAAKAEPVIVQIYENGDLLAVLPLVRRRSLSFNLIEFADLGVSDYNDFPASRSFNATPELVAAVRHALAPYDFISVRKIRSTDTEKFSILGRQEITRLPVQTYASALIAPFSAWKTKSYSSSFEKFISRKLRLLQRFGEVKFRVLQDRREIENALDLLKSFRADRFNTLGITDPLQKPSVLSFYKSIGVKGVTNGSAATYELSLNGNVIAIIFGIAHQLTFSFLLMGFDFNNYRNYSLGLLAIERAICARIEQGDKCFDFMIGEQSYKKDFGTEATEIFSIWIGNGPVRHLIVRAVARWPLLQRIAKRFART